MAEVKQCTTTESDLTKQPSSSGSMDSSSNSLAMFADLATVAGNLSSDSGTAKHEAETNQLESIASPSTSVHNTTALKRKRVQENEVTPADALPSRTEPSGATTPVAQTKRARSLTTPQTAHSKSGRHLAPSGVSLINLTPSATPFSTASSTPLKSPASLPDGGDPNAVPAPLASWVKDGRVVLKGYKYKGAWTDEEDEMLVKIVKDMGPRKWSRIAAKLGSGRNSKQCRERWSNQVNPDLKRDKWTKEEDDTIIQAHEEFGNSWAKIAALLPGRTDNMIKNRYNGSLKTRHANGSSSKSINAGTPKSSKKISRASSRATNSTQKVARSQARNIISRAKGELIPDSDAERTAVLALGGLSASPAKPKRRRVVSTASTFATGGAKRSLSTWQSKPDDTNTINQPPAPTTTSSVPPSGLPPRFASNNRDMQEQSPLRPTGHTPGRSRSREKNPPYQMLRRRSPQPTTPVPVPRVVGNRSSPFSATKPSWQPQFDQDDSNSGQRDHQMTSSSAGQSTTMVLRSVYKDKGVAPGWEERFYYFAHPDAVAHFSKTSIDSSNGMDGEGTPSRDSRTSPARSILDGNSQTPSPNTENSVSPRHRPWLVVKVRFYWNCGESLATLAQPLAGFPVVNAIHIPSSNPYANLQELHIALHAKGHVQDCAQKKRLRVYKIPVEWVIPTDEALDLIHGQLAHPKAVAVSLPTTTEAAHYMLDVSRSTPKRSNAHCNAFNETTPASRNNSDTVRTPSTTPKFVQIVGEHNTTSRTSEESTERIHDAAAGSGTMSNVDSQQPSIALNEIVHQVAGVVQRKAKWNVSTKPCHCKKSKCLKMYCECFTSMSYCGPQCKCIECHNQDKVEFHEEWTVAYARCNERNPFAFAKTNTVVTRCKCRNTQCLKKYCDCYRAGSLCTVSCQCQNCSNSAESALLGLSVAKGSVLLANQNNKLVAAKSTGPLPIAPAHSSDVNSPAAVLNEAER